MTIDRRLFTARMPLPAEGGDEYRARVQYQQSENIERRRLELIEQASESRTPLARIRIWEHLHKARLPKDPEHRLIPVIAAGTRLTVEEVLVVQRERFGEAPAKD